MSSLLAPYITDGLSYSTRAAHRMTRLRQGLPASLLPKAEVSWVNSELGQRQGSRPDCQAWKRERSGPSPALILQFGVVYENGKYTHNLERDSKREKFRDAERQNQGE